MKKLNSLPVIGLIAFMLMGYAVSQAQEMFTVKVEGKGQPMILIHGLYCSGEVWKETVDRYKQKYECHVLTLAGFGGNTPKASDRFLESVKDEVIAYSKNEKLKNPILLGHSMGAFISLWAASSEPSLFDHVIAVDGLPYLTAIQMPGATPESAKSMALNMKKVLETQTPEQVRQNQNMYLPTMITSKERVQQVLEIAVKSDPKTQAQVMYEMFTTDLRNEVGAIKCPVLLLGAWVAYKDYGVTHDSAMNGYSEQVSEIEDCKVVMNDTAKHFIFFDDPEWFYSQVDKFLIKG